MPSSNPRYGSNGRKRIRLAKQVRSMGLPCGICRGLRGPIHYDEPTDEDWRELVEGNAAPRFLYG